MNHCSTKGTEHRSWPELLAHGKKHNVVTAEYGIDRHQFQQKCTQWIITIKLWSDMNVVCNIALTVDVISSVRVHHRPGMHC